MNKLRGKIRETMTGDATLAALLGAATRVYPGWPDREVPLTAALPAYICCETHKLARSGTVANAEGQSYRLVLHVFGITEPVCWQVSDRLETLFHGQRLLTAAKAVMTIVAGTASIVPEPSAGAHHLVQEFSLSNAFTR